MAHNIINMTDIPAELDLAGAGLDYMEMDPFSVAVRADGRIVRFFRSVDATVDSIADVDRAEGEAYRRFIDVATPVSRPCSRPCGESAFTHRPLANLAAVARLAGPAPAEGLVLVRDVLGPYDSLLRRRLPSDLTRGPVAAFAAHASVGPTGPRRRPVRLLAGRLPPLRPVARPGRRPALADALARRLGVLGRGAALLHARRRHRSTRRGRVRAVVTEAGERIPAATVVTAVDPKVALLDLARPAARRRGRPPIWPPCGGATSSRPSSTSPPTACPPTRDARPGDWNGLQSYIDRLDDLTAAWVAAEAGLLPDPLPLYAFTPTAIDPGLAPPGGHTVYLACPAAPATDRRGLGGPPGRVRRTRPGRARGPRPRHGARPSGPWPPAHRSTWTREGWPGAHPMHLDIGLDQLGLFRPTPRLNSHRTPIEGLYISGAGTSPTGGIAGTPGRQAARAVLADERRRR